MSHPHLKDSSPRDRGATLLEYAVVLSVLVAVFVAAARTLEASARSRITSSVETARTTAPCEGLTDPQQCL
ncbi:MAG: hypothetical protein RL417_918 [Pseudomonadota bacterium]